MSKELSPAGPRAAHLDDLRAGIARPIQIASGLGAVAFLSFAAIDPFLVSGSLVPVYTVRAVSIGLLLLLVAGTRSPALLARAGLALAVAAFIVIGGGVIAVTWITGGGDSRYHEALILTMLGFALLPLPWRFRDVAVLFFGLVFAYDLVMVLTGRTGSPSAWWPANAALWMSGLVAVVLFRLQMELRRSEFERRQELAAANTRLTELDRAKNRFFANLSHELRTPLTLVLAPVQALMADPRYADQADQDQLALVERNALRLLRLLDDLLELTRAEAANLRLKLEPIDTTALVQALVEDVRPLAIRKGVQLSVEAEGAPPTIQADRGQVERILLNLLSNAMKFTPDGGSVTLRVQARAEGVEVCVDDSGPGVPDGQLERIFDRFYQVDGSATRRHGGTGIGLALARELVVLHGGTLTAENRPEGGARLRLRLPPAPPSSAPIERRSGARAGGPERREVPSGLPEWHEALRRERAYRLMAVDDATERRILPRRRHTGGRATILLVEDNPDMVRFLGALLGGDYNVLAASDGEMGLRLAREKRPDIILSDVMMPRMDGLQMVGRLREDDATRGIPIVLLTARGEARDRVEGHVHGADAYLVKPFSGAEVLAAVRALLDRTAALRRAGVRDVGEALRYVAGGLGEALEAPLAELAAALERLPAGDGQTGATDALGRIRAAIDQLAELAASTGGPPAEVVAAETLVRRVAEGFAGEEPRVRLSVNTPGWISARVLSIERALGQLVRHAQRTTRPGGGVRLTLDDDTDGGVVIAVHDDGPGVPPEHAERIFIPFHGEGGVALALSRRLVEAEGGRLYLDTGVHSGSRFVLRLPAAAAP